MSALATKLDRLRAQAGQPAAARVGAAEAAKLLPLRNASTSLPGSEASRLPPLPQEANLPRPAGGVPESIRRMLGICTRALSPVPPRAFDRALPGDEIAPGLRYRELSFDWGPAPGSLDASFAKDFAHIDRRDVLAFDTETTGLAGGTGRR